jgi:hypothetical protein
MNKMIEDNYICDNIEDYKLLFDDIYNNLIKNNYEECNNYLIMSELYLKILYDKNIKKIIEEYFDFFDNENQNYFSLNILLKILFLRISQILYDASNISIELLLSDEIIDKYYNIYQIISCIKYICDKYLVNNNNNNKIDLRTFKGCGKCHLGDGIRCKNCPFRGFPAFNIEDKIKVIDEFNMKKNKIESENNNIKINPINSTIKLDI